MTNGISILTQGRPRHIAGGEPRSTETDWSQAIGDENQLIRAETDTGATPAGSRWKVEFVYDDKLRMRKQLSSTWSGATWGTATEVGFLYDGMLIVQERTGANAVIASYLRGLDLSGSYSGAGGIDGLLMRSAWNGIAYVHSFYHADGIGNITCLRKSDGTETASYRYEPFGRLVSTAPGAGTLGDVNKMRFSSKYLDGNTGFYYYGYRFYDPGTQKWLNRDPLGDVSHNVYFQLGIWLYAKSNVELLEGPNLYSFVNRRPIGLVDPNGLLCGSGWNDQWVPDGYWMFDFSDACSNHDKCYGNCGMSKSQCDDNFRYDMFEECERLGLGGIIYQIACRTIAHSFFLFVHHLGGEPYSDAQREAGCDCE